MQREFLLDLFTGATVVAVLYLLFYAWQNYKILFVIHSYLSPKDKIKVYCSETKNADIYLNGDNTTISDEELSYYKEYVLFLRTKPMQKWLKVFSR